MSSLHNGQGSPGLFPYFYGSKPKASEGILGQNMLNMNNFYGIFKAKESIQRHIYNINKLSQIRNLNMSLKEAVQQQLDLILRLQEERKVMKKQNKVLKQKIHQLMAISEKCIQQHPKAQTIDCQANTQKVQYRQEYFKQNQKKNINLGQQNRQQFGCQFPIEQQTPNLQKNNSSSKLKQAQQMLQNFDKSSKIKHQEMNGFSLFNQKNKKLQKNTTRIATSRASQSNVSQLCMQNSFVSNGNAYSNINVENLTNEIVRMSKQINSLKKELQNSQHQRKQKEKQIKQISKCLETKSEALTKVRKQFNDLSQILNTDKYKSIKNIEKQLKQTKQELLKQMQSNQILKQMLKGIAQEYKEFKEQTQSQMEVLKMQRKKDRLEIELLSKQNQKYRKLLGQYQRTQKYLTRNYETDQ